MAVTLTYEPTVSRVAIAATGLGVATAATVERSTDQARWTTVRGASAASVSGGAIAIPLYDYEFVVGVANYYRVTAVPTGLHVPAAAANASTPDTATLRVTGDIQLTVDLSMNDWTPAVATDLVGRWVSPSNLSYALFIDTAGKPIMCWTTSGAAGTAHLITATAALPVANAARVTVRATLDVDNGSAGNTVTFFCSLDAGATYTQLGSSIVTSGPTSVFAGTASLTVAANAGDWSGVVHSAEVRNGIAGTVVANPQFDAQDHLAPSFVDDAGRTWTVNGAAAILTDQTAAITPGDTVDCGGSAIWLKNISRPFLNRPVDVINPGAITVITRPARVGIFDIVGRSYPIAVSDLRKSRRWTMTVRTYTENDAYVMDLLLAAGDVLFVQTPPNCSVPGGYVAVGGIDRTAHPLRPNRITWTLPCTEVAAPGPDVVGTSVTWQTVIDFYDSWSAVTADQGSWAELLTLIGSPTEVIVP